MTKSTQIFKNYEKNKENIFFYFWIFNDEREKHKNDPKHKNYESKHMMHVRTLWMSRWTPRTLWRSRWTSRLIFEKFLRKEKYARHQTWIFNA